MIKTYLGVNGKTSVLINKNTKKIKVGCVISETFLGKIKHIWEILNANIKDNYINVYDDFELYYTEMNNFINDLIEINQQDKDIVFNVEKLKDSAILPMRGTEGSIGWDVATPETFQLMPGEQKLIPLGFKIGIKPGYEIQIRSRSSVPYKYRCMVSNGIGTVDQDYRGEIKVLLFNYGNDGVRFDRGERIAQLVVKKSLGIKLVQGKVDDVTKRGEGGFGSTN